MARMRILTNNEQEAFDRPPVFDHKERKQFLVLPKGLMEIATGLRSPDSQIGFLLMCGYFKATKRFYRPHNFHVRDIAFAAHQLDVPENTFQPRQYAETTRLRHQRLILEFHGFVSFDERASKGLATEIATMARMHLKPRLIFDRCVDFLIQRHVQVPTARRLTDLIRASLHERKAELVTLMDSKLPAETRSQLDGLLG